ncbi:sulfite exporter TauE/SafE family protein [Polaromonas sp.]|uniref:sulfite exporter TauE/SafE family protein n=1 Tax=Polaromonas sp. TaxID=1869339 RepID=UPI002FCBC543
MQTTLAATALLMGLAGGPHCIAMCGAACAAASAGNGRAGGGKSTRSLWIFQAGRVVGYSSLGGIAAASMQGLGWLSVQSAALRPVWTLFHVAAALLGMMLLWQARQPVWLENTARKVWGRVRAVTEGSRGAAPLLLGVLWALLPCGLLYSALLVAALTSSMLEGAAVMALFALGSSVSLMAGPWLWLRLRGQGSGQWAVRLAGLALSVTSLWGLWVGLVHNTAPWCLPP